MLALLQLCEILLDIQLIYCNYLFSGIWWWMYIRKQIFVHDDSIKYSLHFGQHVSATKKKTTYRGPRYTGHARASLGLSSLGQFFRQCLGPHFLLWNLDFWYARSLGQNEKNWKKHFSKNWKLTFSGPSIDFWLFFSSLSLYWPQATPLDLQP